MIKNLFIILFVSLFIGCTSQKSISYTNIIKHDNFKKVNIKQEGKNYSLEKYIPNIKLNSIYFDKNKFKLNISHYKILNKNLKHLEKYISNPNIILRIEGNTDISGGDEYNMALGLKRANSVKKYYINKGIKEKKLIITSYGYYNNKCNENNKCSKQNRRTDFKIIDLTKLKN